MELVAQDPLPTSDVPQHLLPPFECGMVMEPAVQPKSIPCTPVSTTWLNKYRRPDHWKADSITPVKTILVNFVVCQDDNGNGWQDTSAFYEQIDLMFDRINEYFTNIPQKGYSLTCDPLAEHITDSKIRFEFNEAYFLKNTTWYNAGLSYGIVSDVLDSLFAIHPEARGQLNHVFTQSPNNSSGGFGHYLSSVSGEAAVQSRSMMFSDFWMVPEWVGHFTHEYGHALNMRHSYPQYPTHYRDMNHFDYLDDVYGACPEPALEMGGACHEGCNPAPGWVCTFNQCFHALENDTTFMQIENEDEILVDSFTVDYAYTDLMSGRLNKYISPKSTGKFHRALSFYDETFGLNQRNMHKYVKEKYPYLADYQITEDETWDFAIKMYQNIVVTSGNTLTITCEVRMPIEGKIIVEPGAKLVVDGGRIMNAHEEMWHGIEVAGDTDQHQYSYGGGNYHQGRLILKNGAVIENARKGVRNMLDNDWSARGGIIQASNSSFINCKRAAEFMSYQNFSPSNPSFNRPDQSFFRECLFEVNDDYLEDQDQFPPFPRITLWQIDRVQIQGCDFINTSAVAETSNRGVAVSSHDANYMVIERCLDYPQQFGVCNDDVPNLFRGWYKAVEAKETSSGRPITVRNSIFEKNMIGIEIRGAEFSEIYKNEMSVGNHPFPIFDEETVDTRNHLGIYANETMHYSIEENEITNPSGASYPGHGILVENCQGAENVVYKNTLKNLLIGTEGYNINRNTQTAGGVPAGLAGLQFLCNLNSGNDVDFEISRVSSSTDQFIHDHAGVRQNHGSDNPDRGARNTFSLPNADPNTYTHFTVSSEFAYKYFYDITPPDLNEITPNTFIVSNVSTSQGCPSNYTTGPIDSPNKDVLFGKLDEFYGLFYTYQQTIDDGNTSGILNIIDLTWPNDAWQLRDELIARSPYNSEEVLVHAALREIMPHAMLLEVLLANPDALRSSRVIRAVETQLSNPMPDYMIDLLYAARDQTTLRTAMENSLAELNSDGQRLWKRMISKNYFTEDVSVNPDSIIFYLGKIKTVEANYSRASVLADQGQFSTAIALLDSMQNNYKLPLERQHEIEALKTLYALLSGIDGDDRTIAQLNQVEIGQLTNLALSPQAGIAAAKAENALCFHYNICFDDNGNPKSQRQPKSRPTKKELVDQLNGTAVFPNPASDYVTVEYQLIFAHENTTLQIFDALGREVEMRTLGKKYAGQELLDTRNWSPGLYIYQVLQKEEVVDDGKFAISR